MTGKTINIYGGKCMNNSELINGILNKRLTEIGAKDKLTEQDVKEVLTIMRLILTQEKQDDEWRKAEAEVKANEDKMAVEREKLEQAKVEADMHAKAEADRLEVEKEKIEQAKADAEARMKAEANKVQAEREKLKVEWAKAKVEAGNAKSEMMTDIVKVLINVGATGISLVFGKMIFEALLKYEETGVITSVAGRAVIQNFLKVFGIGK
jgi:hypothetical protein